MCMCGCVGVYLKLVVVLVWRLGIDIRIGYQMIFGLIRQL